MSRMHDVDPCTAGWPRRTKAVTLTDEDGTDRDVRLPIPWVGAPEIVADDYWLGFRDDAHLAHTERRCAVCGERIEGLVVLGAYRGDGRRTDGPGLHPRCMWMTANVCPHFAPGGTRPEDATVVCYVYAGDGVGYRSPQDREELYCGPVEVDERATPMTMAGLAALARSDPWGTASGTPFDPRAVADGIPAPG